MIDEDLQNLWAILCRMDPDAPIAIGVFRCHAHELLVVVSDALVHRARRAVCSKDEP